MIAKSDQARSCILGWIQNGDLRPGQRIESERELARRMGMNHQTVRRALADLLSEGWIVKQPRVGTFVRHANHIIPVALALPAWMTHGASWNPTVGFVMEGLTQALNARQYALSPLIYRPEHFAEDVGQIVAERGIQGVVLWPHDRLAADDLRRLRERNVHIVTLAPPLPHLSGLGLPSFSFDWTAIVSEILEGLVARGHHRIAVVLFKNSVQPALEAALKERYAQFGLQNPQEVTLWLSSDYQALDELFRRRPTAVIAPDELVCSEIFKRCYRQGVRIPDDLSLAAAGDLTPSTHPVPMTAPDTVYWTRQISRQAGEHLGQLLERKNPLAAQVRFYAPVQWKASVKSVTAEEKGA